MSNIRENARGGLPEQPAVTEVSPQRRLAVDAFNSAFIRYRNEMTPLEWKIIWNAYDRNFVSNEEMGQVAGFHIVRDGVKLVTGRTDLLDTDEPLSPFLDSYTYKVKFPHRSSHYAGGENVLEEHIVITPLLEFLERERETLAEMVDDAERVGGDSVHYIDALARTERELAVLFAHSNPYLDTVGMNYKQPRWPLFESRRSLEAFYISKSPLRMSTAPYQASRDNENWADASRELMNRRVLVVP